MLAAAKSVPAELLDGRLVDTYDQLRIQERHWHCVRRVLRPKLVCYMLTRMIVNLVAICEYTYSANRCALILNVDLQPHRNLCVISASLALFSTVYMLCC